MKKPLKAFFVSALLALGLFNVAAAGPLEDGQEA